jgi:hypothetical protein
MFGTSSVAWDSFADDSGELAFAVNTRHVLSMNTLIIPSGQAGLLKVQLYLKQVYTFDPDYSWFRVSINGVAIPDENGETYFHPILEEIYPFTLHIYDLSSYQDGAFQLSLESCCKYYPGYHPDYPWGDCAYVDDFKVYYEEPAVVPLSSGSVIIVFVLIGLLILIKYLRIDS